MIALARNGSTVARARRLSLRRKLKTGPRESVIQAAVVRLLTFTAHADVVWFHVPNGGGRHKVEAARLVGQGVRPGVPDIVLIRRGQAFGLELKAVGGRLSPAQKQMHERWVAAGGYVATVYGIDEAIAQLEAWSLVRKRTTPA